MKKTLSILALSIVLFSCKETATEVIRDDTMVTASPQFKSSTMEIASPTERF
jgi:cobalt-zinc-cadmium efflux system membrane fusion protein